MVVGFEPAECDDDEARPSPSISPPRGHYYYRSAPWGETLLLRLRADARASCLSTAFTFGSLFSNRHRFGYGLCSACLFLCCRARRSSVPASVSRFLLPPVRVLVALLPAGSLFPVPPSVECQSERPKVLNCVPKVSRWLSECFRVPP